MKKLLSFVLVICLVISCCSLTAMAADKTIITSTDGSAIRNTASETAVKGIMGRSADDGSTLATTAASGKMYFVTGSGANGWKPGEAYENGYIVYGTSFYSLQNCNGVTMQAQSVNVTGQVKFTDEHLHTGWNKVVFVYQPSTSDGKISTTDTTYYCGNWTAYVNGVEVNTWGENRVKITHEYQVNMPNFRLNFGGSSKGEMKVYVDDGFMYLTNTKPDLSQTAPTLETKEFFYTVEGNAVTTAYGVTVSDVTADDGSAVRVYSDSTCTTLLDSEAPLLYGNTIVLEKDGLFSYYTVSEEKIVNDTLYWGFEDNKLPNTISLTNVSSTSFSNGIFNGVTKTTDGMIYLNVPFEANDFNQLRVRMKYTPVEGTTTTNQYLQVFYEGVASNESVISMNGANSETANVDVSKSGEYFTYTINFDNNNWAGASITKLRLDPMNVQGTFDIDYIMLCKSGDTLDWQFTSGMEGWAKPYNSVKGTYVAENGVVKGEVTPAMGGVDTQLAISGLSINPALYKQIEFIGSINITAEGATSDTLKLYYGYTDSTGAAQGYHETKAFKYTTPVTTNGEYRRFVFDISEKSDYLTGSTITSLRTDFVNSYGSFEIDSIRFIGADVITYPLDASGVSVEYTFANNDAGCAMGTIRMNYGQQSSANALSVNLCWASGNATDGYVPLEEYTPLYSFDGEKSVEGYTIAKNILIPEDATALVAKVRDIEKTFTVAYDIPSEKRIEKQEPKFVLALASDFHFGWVGAAMETVSFQNSIKNHITANADALAVVGDITQMYGAHSVEAYNNMTDDDPDNDNPTAGVSQFDQATDFFEKFTIPVYMIEGNHDTPEGKFKPELTNGATSAERYKNYLANWLDYSAEQGFYEDEIIRETIMRNGVEQFATFYDDYINGYHLICLRAPHEGDYTMADGELDWLDAKLYEYEESGKPVFVFTHAPLKGTVGLNNVWQFSNDIYASILAKHPNVIAVSGHSHFNLDEPDIVPVIDGKGDAPSFIHDGGIVNTADIIFDDEGKYVDDVAVRGRAMWTYAEIYDDRVITRGYSLNDGKYVSQAVGQITLMPECTIDELVVNSQTAGAEVTYTASCATPGLTYQWYVDGVAADTGVSVTVAEDFEGYIAVRATDADGQYRSMSYNTNKNGRRALIQSDSQREAVVLFASYSGDDIVDIVLKDVSLKTGVNVVEIPQIDTANADTVLAYVWENLDNIKPIIEPVYTLK